MPQNKPSGKTICVVGLGYIGLPTALLLADAGNQVLGFDVDQIKIKQLEAGLLPFSEHGLPELFATVQNKRTFTATTSIQSADVYIIAVPTPHTGKSADLQYIVAALSSIKPVFPKNGTIVIESTVGPRDCIDILEPLVAAWEIPFSFAHCPERAIPGNTLHEMVHNERIVGGRTPADTKKVITLYSTFVQGKLHGTTTTVAASCKVMENTYRAVNIALANEFALIAEQLEFNVWEAISLANKHPRVNIHAPGPGVGGHCIPIDPWFFAQTQQEVPSVISTALTINDTMPSHVVKQVEREIKLLKLQKPVIGILGLSYKKNVDDTRESPGFPIIKKLQETFSVMITDPYVTHSPAMTITSLEEVLHSADVIVLITDHDEYTSCNFSSYPNISVVLDTRNILSEIQFVKFQGIWKTLGNGA